LPDFEDFLLQEGLFMHKPVYDHQALDALVLHAYYVSKHLGNARRLGHAAALYVQSEYPGPKHRARNAQLYMDLEQQLKLNVDTSVV
jgi:hypothetical protein